MEYSGGTFSELKTTLCAKEITVLGHCCTMEGWLPDESRVAKIVNWGPCKDLTDVCAFLGAIGICRLFIKNFSHYAHHLVKLTRKAAPWEFGQDQISAMENLKQALLFSPVLPPIYYASTAPVILSVDTSQIAVSFILPQCNLDNPKHWYYAQFGSITLNGREAKSSQPKLELYGLYHALRLLKLYLIGIQSLIIELMQDTSKEYYRTQTSAPHQAWTGGSLWFSCFISLWYMYQVLWMDSIPHLISFLPSIPLYFCSCFRHILVSSIDSISCLLSQAYSLMTPSLTCLISLFIQSRTGI